jgi:putative methyltransferase (TIGR04325 family)
MTLRNTLREWLPPVILRQARRLTGRGLRFDGNYTTWQDAQRASGGYDREDIVRRVYESELKVKQGVAADERDGVLFDAVQFSLPVMAALARIVCLRQRPLRVLDFGGAFGGMYRQYRAFGLPPEVSWNVVEQPAFLRVGRDAFETPTLRFASSIGEVLADGLPDVALFSSVLQYLEQPMSIFQQIADAGIPHVIIDRTPFHDRERNLLVVQHVPVEIYKASYPCWIFSHAWFMASCGDQFRQIALFTDGSGTWRAPGLDFQLRGFAFDRKH